MASRLVFGGTCATVFLFAHESLAATYVADHWFLSGSVSFDALNSSTLNDATRDAAPLAGLIGGRLQLERGWLTPALTHWFELGFLTGSASGEGDLPSGGTAIFDQKLSYVIAYPLGATWWFSRTAYIDFGVSAGAGLVFAPSYSVSVSPDNGAVTESSYGGGVSPVLTARLQARGWLSSHVALNLGVGLQYHRASLAPASDGESLSTSLTSITIQGGLTFAFGGTPGLGRKYVEVIHDQPDKANTPEPRR